ncbi:MAG: cytochrome c oxidase subunit 3 [Acidobacteriaceae bacterium]|nr:cytochrome c oxidase subunit 3 [Acidobacteriaceae bacterium]MBV9781878.1 cytochrome c oxidase subunit 3 [Acidobacteriaceae bacterium]
MSPATDSIARERDLNSLSVLTVTIALATVTMTFGAMIAAFLIRSLAPRFWHPITLPRILWATTAILLSSSITFEAARRRLRRNDQPGFFRLMTWTTALGVVFLAGQITAWFQILRSGVILTRNPHSWFIFLFTGLHGLHILAGLAGLGYLLFRTYEPASGPKYQMNTRVIANAVSIFWHYLDFLWIVLFVLLLAWRR